MQNIFVELLPPWIETGLQPAFYDKESGTVLQQTARMYAKVNELITGFDDLSKDTHDTVEEYIDKFNELNDDFVELHDYVEDYFENLDVQTEINNKLDAMVEDGTLAEMIDPVLEAFEAEIRDQVNTIGDVTNLQTVLKDNVVNGVNCANENYIGLLREKYGNKYSTVNILENEPFFTSNVAIFKDAHDNNYQYYCNVEAHKNTGGTTIYVDKNTDVPAGEQDGTEEKPYSKISTAYHASSNGDTIAVASGFYNRNETGNFDLVKSVNIVAKEGEPNKVFCAVCDGLTWTANDTYTNVYQATRSNTKRIIDIRARNKDVFSELPLAESLEACSNTLNSCYIDGSTIYANIGETVSDDNICATLQVGTGLFRIGNNGANTNVYFENLTFIGGTAGAVSVTGTAPYDCMFTAKNCNFYFGYGTSYDAISVIASNTIFENCKACFADKDGFNYHGSGSKHCKSIEINCIGANNGAIGGVTTYNGSTTHAGNAILRINGTYFNNHGANVCDVGTDTVSINIGCKSFDSIGGTGSAKSDFNAQQAGTTMKLYNCYSKGSNSRYNIYAVENTTIDVYNCKYDRTGGDGTITIH